MKKFFQTVFIIAVLFSLFPPFSLGVHSNRGLDGFQENTLDVTKNARGHSNLGNIYFSEKNYIAALEEYKLAYNLAHHTQAGSSYLYNISRCYVELGNYSSAKNALEEAIRKDYRNITYYSALVDCFIALGTYESELKHYLKPSQNPYDRIVAGLIYMKTGQTLYARILFDEFINSYPNLDVTQEVKAIMTQYLDD